MTEIIAITGNNHSGKTTTAAKIAKSLSKRGHTFVVRSFATPLKVLASKYFDYDEENKLAQRDILERFSFDLKTMFGQGLFAYTLLDECEDLKVDYIIIDDLRYEEEFELLVEFFPTTVVKTPKPAKVDDADMIRIKRLTDHFDLIKYEYIQMKSLSDYAIKDILYGLE